MIVMRTPVVIPTKPEFFVMLVMIGIFGFLGQVRRHSYQLAREDSCMLTILSDTFNHGTATRDRRTGYYGCLCPGEDFSEESRGETP